MKNTVIIDKSNHISGYRKQRITLCFSLCSEQQTIAQLIGVRGAYHFTFLGKNHIHVAVGIFRINYKVYNKLKASFQKTKVCFYATNEIFN